MRSVTRAASTATCDHCRRASPFEPGLAGQRHRERAVQLQRRAHTALQREARRILEPLGQTFVFEAKQADLKLGGQTGRRHAGTLEGRGEVLVGSASIAGVPERACRLDPGERFVRGPGARLGGCHRRRQRGRRARQEDPGCIRRLEEGHHMRRDLGEARRREGFGRERGSRLGEPLGDQRQTFLEFGIETAQRRGEQLQHPFGDLYDGRRGTALNGAEGLRQAGDRAGHHRPLVRLDGDEQAVVAQRDEAIEESEADVSRLDGVVALQRLLKLAAREGLLRPDLLALEGVDVQDRVHSASVVVMARRSSVGLTAAFASG